MQLRKKFKTANHNIWTYFSNEDDLLWIFLNNDFHFNKVFRGWPADVIYHIDL